MLPDLMALKGLFKIDPIKNDNNIFRFHYKLTVIFLATFATIISLKQYVGDPIDCFVDGAVGMFKDTNVLDNYCWIHSTYTLPNQPGIKYNNEMKLAGMGTQKEDEPVIYHKYYQWVGFFLIFQALCFYVPRLVWKMREAGKLRTLCEDLTSVLVPNDIEVKGRKTLSNYLFVNLNQHQIYAASFFICELLTLINVIGQIYLIDAFLGGEFTTYGVNVVQQSGMDPEERMDPMSMIFPKTAKCTFKSYGPSGTIQTYDAFCVLPVNIINEKIFIFLWFWFIILATLTAVSCLVRIATIAVPKFRLFLLQKKAGLGVDKERVNLIFRRCQIGDWFILMLVGENVTQWVYDELLDELAERFQGKSI